MYSFYLLSLNTGYMSAAITVPPVLDTYQIIKYLFIDQYVYLEIMKAAF